MIYRNLGRSGLQISALSFGSWITFGNQIEDNTSEELMKMAYEAGINFFDNAEVYAAGQSEIVMGQILKKMGWRRDTYAVSSKVFFGIGAQLPMQKGLNRKHVTEACHQALERLQVDYLDLYLCHRPDKLTPIEETVWSMHNLIVQGKVLYWGTSEWSGVEIMEAHRVAAQHHLIGPVVEQPQYNLFTRQKVEVEFDQIYRNVGLGTTIWSPLASGLLTGKYNGVTERNVRLKRLELNWLAERNLIEENLRKVAELQTLALEIGSSLPRMSIAWCLTNPNVSTAILGASQTAQLEENLKALDDLEKLTPDVLERIEEIMQNKPKKPVF